MKQMSDTNETQMNYEVLMEIHVFLHFKKNFIFLFIDALR